MVGFILIEGTEYYIIHVITYKLEYSINFAIFYVARKNTA